MSVTVDAASVESRPTPAASPVAHVTPFAAVTDDADEVHRDQAYKDLTHPDESRSDEADSLISTWRAISACHARTCAVLERELGERHGLGISDFEVLARLAEAAEHKYRAQDLADAVHLSQSALSRLVDRLARHGLVQRYTCDMDRRGIYVQLTDDGQRRYAQAKPTHLDILRRTLPGELIPLA